MFSIYAISLVFLLIWPLHSSQTDITLSVESATMNDTMQEVAIRIMKKALMYFSNNDDVVKHVSLSFGAMYDDRNWNVFNVDDNRLERDAVRIKPYKTMRV